MRKIFLICLLTMGVLGGREHNVLHPMKPAYFASRKGFGCTADFCTNLTWIKDPSFMTDFFLHHPQFLKSSERETSTYDETLLEYLVFHAKNGDILWIEESKVPAFFKKIAPKMNKELILITTGDPTFPSGYDLSSEEIDSALESSAVIHIFAQNNNYQGRYKEKVSYLPIGLDYSRPLLSDGFPTAQEDVMKKILSRLHKTTDRPVRPFCDFALNNNGGDRFNAAKILAQNDVADFLDQFIDRTLLWKIKGSRAFDISPSGAGQDCYRTWEALTLGCIVILKTSFLDPLYEGLPVVIVNDWSDITEENLYKWLLEYGDVFHNPQMRERLTYKYWMDQIRHIQRSYKTTSLN